MSINEGTVKAYNGILSSLSEGRNSNTSRVSMLSELSQSQQIRSCVIPPTRSPQASHVKGDNIG